MSFSSSSAYRMVGLMVKQCSAFQINCNIGHASSTPHIHAVPFHFDCFSPATASKGAARFFPPHDFIVYHSRALQNLFQVFIFCASELSSIRNKKFLYTFVTQEL